jgi:hypothetical protein
MNTCKTCKHWTHPDYGNPNYFVVKAGFGTCECPKLDKSYTNGQPATDDMILPRGGGPMDVCTGPDFGCIHHQTK